MPTPLRTSRQADGVDGCSACNDFTVSSQGISILTAEAGWVIMVSTVQPYCLRKACKMVNARASATFRRVCARDPVAKLPSLSGSGNEAYFAAFSLFLLRHKQLWEGSLKLDVYEGETKKVAWGFCGARLAPYSQSLYNIRYLAYTSTSIAPHAYPGVSFIRQMLPFRLRQHEVRGHQFLGFAKAYIIRE